MTNFFHISIICLSVDYTGNNRVGIDSSGLKILSVVSDGKLTSRFTKPLNRRLTPLNLWTSQKVRYYGLMR